MTRPSNLTGQVFNSLIVLRRAPNCPRGNSVWVCQCECGNKIDVLGYKLKSGHNKSCGCARGGVKTHGLSNSLTYKTWVGMKSRCYNKNTKKYKHYGGRGIKVCEHWFSSFENFLADMGEKPRGMSIERLDVNGDYSPENCKWASDSEQALNKRNSIILTYNGQTKPLKTWCELLGRNYDTVHNRITNGWSTESALGAL